MAELMAKGYSSLTEEFSLNRFKEGKFIDERVWPLVYTDARF